MHLTLFKTIQTKLFFPLIEGGTILTHQIKDVFSKIRLQMFGGILATNFTIIKENMNIIFRPLPIDYLIIFIYS